VSRASAVGAGPWCEADPVRFLVEVLAQRVPQCRPARDGPLADPAGRKGLRPSDLRGAQAFVVSGPGRKDPQPHVDRHATDANPPYARPARAGRRAPRRTR
jgi:hypothetical protein